MDMSAAPISLQVPYPSSACLPWFAAEHSAAAFKEKEAKRRHLTDVVAILLFAWLSLINL
jgi:hypothetical protein